RSPSRPRLLKTAPERRLFTPSLQQIEPWAWASMSTVSTLAPPPNRFSSADGGSSTFSQRGITPSADEPKGDQEPQHLYKVADFAYTELEHYPYGISSNYTGSRLGRGEYPKLEVLVAKRRLMYEDDSTSSLSTALCNEVTARLITTSMPRKLSNSEEWNTVLHAVSMSEHLPPSTRRWLVSGAVDA